MALSVLVWLAVIILRRCPRRAPAALPLIVIVFVVCYEAFIIITSLIADSAILAEERIQLPMLIAATIFVFSTVPRLLVGKTSIRAAAALTIAFGALSCGRAVEWAGDAYLNGQSFSSARWAASPTVQQVRNIPPDAQIFSNSPQLIYAQTGRVAWFLPSRIDFTRLPNQEWARNMDRLRWHINKNGGVMVAFRGVNASVPPVETDIEANLTVRRVFEAPDGVIFAPAE